MTLFENSFAIQIYLLVLAKLGQIFSFGGNPLPRVYNIIKSPLQRTMITAQDVPFTLLYSHYEISETEGTMGCLSN